MASVSAEQAAMIELMSGKYRIILDIESEWAIRFQEGDMRPRIEYFHDAVRTLTSGNYNPDDKRHRLSVEHLAYDLAMLREVQARPVGHINRATTPSFSTAVVPKAQAGAGVSKLPPQSVRSELAQLYKEYTIFFAALFAPAAARNYQTRCDGIDEAVSDIGLIEDIVQQLTSGKMTVAQAMKNMMHVERDDLRERIQAMLANKKLSAKEKHEALALLGKVEKGLAQEKKSLEAAHLNYATGQLAVYEDGKDMVKKLAAAGLNLAGKFLNNAMQSAARGQGRGV